MFVGREQVADREVWGWFVGYPTDRRTEQAVERGYYDIGLGMVTVLLPLLAACLIIPAGVLLAPIIGAWAVLVTTLTVAAVVYPLHTWLDRRHQRRPLEFQQAYVRATDIRLRLLGIVMPGVSFEALGKDALCKSLVDQYLQGTAAAAERFTALRKQHGSTGLMPRSADELALLFGLCRLALALAKRLTADSVDGPAPRGVTASLARHYLAPGRVASQLLRDLQGQRQLLEQ